MDNVRMNRSLRASIQMVAATLEGLKDAALRYEAEADTQDHPEFEDESDIGYRYYQTCEELIELAESCMRQLERDVLMCSVSDLVPDIIEERLRANKSGGA